MICFTFQEVALIKSKIFAVILLTYIKFPTGQCVVLFVMDCAQPYCSSLSRRDVDRFNGLFSAFNVHPVCQKPS